MTKLKLSNIVEKDLYIDSDSFKSLSPKMKDAVREIFESIKESTDDIIKSFEGAVDKVAEKYNINTKLFDDYFDREIEYIILILRTIPILYLYFSYELSGRFTCLFLFV